MQTVAAVAVSLFTIPLVCGALARQSASPPAVPAPAKAQPASEPPPRDHQWLKGLVGEWTTTWRLYVQPDQPPAESVGTDSVRAIGDHWVVAEAGSTMMGIPFSGLMSLGYDAELEGFHGTWIDSFGGRLWVYKGTLSDAGDTLTLETEGPSPMNPGKVVRYREAMRITGPDTRTFTSTYEAGNDEWVTLVVVEFRRK